MDRIDKALARLPVELRRKVVVVIQCIEQGEFLDLDVKKLKGEKDLYRVRKGRVRVKFRRVEGLNIVISVERRGDTTY